MERRRPRPTPYLYPEADLPSRFTSSGESLSSFHLVPRHQRQQTNLGPSASLTLSSLFIVIVLTTQRARQRSRQQHRRQNFPTTLPYAIYSEERGVPATVLVRFCSEGDDTGEATDLALYLNRWKNLFPVAAGKIPPIDWPISWKHLFGNPVPASIY